MQEPYAYQQPDDLRRVQVALMQWTQQIGDCNYWHKGDIRHRLFNMGYQQNPTDILHYWLNESDDVIAFVQLYPQKDGAWFELHVAPELRCTDAHVAMLKWSEENLISYAKRLDKPHNTISIDTFGCDPDYDAFLRANGYSLGQCILTYTEHDLKNIPDATLPDGFHFYDATINDAEKLADVHNNSFTNKWTVELYGKVFAAPLMEYEIVTVAPDGRFASFTNVWLDEINHTILFEPVGTHKDFRRMGIAKAMMVYVLKRMQAEHNIQRAIVCHEPPDDNPASGALYASVGFRPKYQIHEYKKVV